MSIGDKPDRDPHCQVIVRPLMKLIDLPSTFNISTSTFQPSCLKPHLNDLTALLKLAAMQATLFVSLLPSASL
jgi:hypothetical protein